MRRLFAPCAVVALLAAAPAPAQPEPDAIKKAVTLYASFDEHVQADVAGGGKMLNTRTNHPSQPGTFLVEPIAAVLEVRIEIQTLPSPH